MEKEFDGSSVHVLTRARAENLADEVSVFLIRLGANTSLSKDQLTLIAAHVYAGKGSK